MDGLLHNFLMCGQFALAAFFAFLSTVAVWFWDFGGPSSQRVLVSLDPPPHTRDDLVFLALTTDFLFSKAIFLRGVAVNTRSH